VLLRSRPRKVDGELVREDDVRRLAAWNAARPRRRASLHAGAVILQDFTGVPAVVDLASMREP
jgi:aconitate hydratase